MRSSESVTACSLPSAANAVRERIVAGLREQGLAAYDRRAGTGLLRNLVVREGRRTGQIQARLVTSDGKLDRDALIAAAGPELTGLLWTRTDGVAETTQGGTTEVLAGSKRFEETLGQMSFRISAEAFFQTNTEMAERLYELAIEYASPDRLRAAVRPVLRDRDDRPAGLAAGCRGVGPGVD